MRPTSHIAPEDSLDRAAAELRRSGNGLVPVVQELALRGIVTERTLAIALAEGASPSEPATLAMVAAPTVRPYDSAAHALREIAAGAGPTLIVVDDLGRLMGLIGPSDLYPRRLVPPRPALVGGMATPFGVYLTTGAISAGAGGFALMATGALLFCLLTISQIITLPLAEAALEQGWPLWLADFINGASPIILFLTFMRLLPLAGTHAAEHQVVHALERGEDLSTEIVRRMPRVHPRCGTNLAVGAMLFLGIFGSAWIQSNELRFMAAALATVLFWRRIGSLVQFYVTTRPASPRQVQSGIDAAKELLDKYSRSNLASPTVPQKIWRSGMLHVMGGSTLCYLLLIAISWLFNLNLPL